MDCSYEYTVCTAEARPDCWTALQDPSHPLNRAWPPYLDNDLSQQDYANRILDYHGLRKFQHGIIERDTQGGETMIACMRSVPFFWPELAETTGNDDTTTVHSPLFSSLPDEGWDWMVACGIRQYCARQGLSPPPSTSPGTRGSVLDQSYTTHGLADEPNALSALSITVREDRRNRGYAEMLIDAMKRIAREEQLQILVVPLRPTRKSVHAWVSMDKYIGWTGLCSATDKTPGGAILDSSAPQEPILDYGKEGCLPYDPWLRKHVRLGGVIAKIAPASMVVRGSFTQWMAWTGIDFYRWRDDLHQRLKRSKADEPDYETYYEVAFSSRLVLLKVFPSTEVCIYIEPNV
ncbi:MAG: hypothetical protein Q9220_007605 [cf. Caloplaca sp. 1 TL-2023]